MNALVEFLQKLGPSRIAAMGVMTFVLIGFFIFIIMRVSQPSMGLLFSDLSMQDASAIVKDLETRGIHYETRNEGTSILAPRNDLAKLRMDLAGKGIPTQGGVGYEIFDKGDAFSSTSFVQNINHLRALEGELSRTIRSLSRVQSARVHLAIPERRLFERDKELPRASIALKLQGDLDPSQVRAIRHLVASAVEGMKPERVSIVDERGRLLADGSQAEGINGVIQEERQAAIEQRLRQQVDSIVASVVGQGRTKVQISAELDQNRIESRQETFDPESRVLRSSQTRTENQITASNNDTVSVGNELPGANQNQNPTQTSAPKDQANKNEETVNYEISRTTRTEITEGNRLKRVSVAVLVDGIYNKAANGEITYQPRSAEDLERIATLVRSAIGFDSKRGDQVEVVNLRFAEAPEQIVVPPPSFTETLLNPTREDVMRYIELAVLSLLTMIVLYTVVRPLMNKIIGANPESRKKGGTANEGSTFDVDGKLIRSQDTAQMIELAKFNGEIQAKSLEKIGQLAVTNPVETVSVLRGWIHDG